MHKPILVMLLISAVVLKGAYTIEDFKKEYFEECAVSTEKKESLIKYAPLELKQWFQRIKEGQNSQPILLYGACGMGKTTVTKALTKDIGHLLCYVTMLEYMRWDWDERFALEYLDRIQEKTCVIIDNIEHFESDDIQNLNALIEMCNSKDNLHLLVIAYHAKINMPSNLYDRFHPIKFPTLTPQERLPLLKSSFKNVILADDVNDIFFTNLNEKLSNFTFRDIEEFQSAVNRDFRIKRRDKETALSQRYFNNALEDLENTSRAMKWIFDECE